MRMMDEVIDLEGLGIALLCVEGAPRNGMRIRDARGNVHTVSAVTSEQGVYTLLIPEGDAAYFERLFRDVRIAADEFEEVM